MMATPVRRGTGRPEVIALGSVIALGLIAGAVGLVLQLWFNPAAAANRERKAIAAQATDFAAAYATYDASNLPEYRKRVEPMLTSRARPAFEKKTSSAFPALAVLKWAQGDPNVIGVGVSDIDTKKNTAFALVAVDYTATTKGAKQALRFYDRWLLGLSKVGDRWLVSDYSSLTAGVAENANLKGLTR